MSQYATGVYPLGSEAMQGLNDTLDNHDISPVPDDLARLHSGTFLAGKVAMILRGRFDICIPQLPHFTKIVANAFPEFDWTEFDRFKNA